MAPQWPCQLVREQGPKEERQFTGTTGSITDIDWYVPIIKKRDMQWCHKGAQQKQLITISNAGKIAKHYTFAAKAVCFGAFPNNLEKNLFFFFFFFFPPSS
jgi:hypothetical protein